TAVVGPMYAGAAAESTLRQVLTSAPVDESGLHVQAQTDVTVDPLAPILRVLPRLPDGDPDASGRDPCAGPRGRAAGRVGHHVASGCVRARARRRRAMPDRPERRDGERPYGGADVGIAPRCAGD